MPYLVDNVLRPMQLLSLSFCELNRLASDVPARWQFVYQLRACWSRRNPYITQNVLNSSCSPGNQ